MANRALLARITGRVIGVNFRSMMHRQATRLRLTGYVRAFPNRTLEVLAEGPEEALWEFLEFLKVGPPRAEVERIEYEWREYVGDRERFTIEYGE